ncbi:MAG: pyridoxamine 5'-phosphate oxidase [Gammaproteobacteria bacterium]|nr:pyridoxamine 5'-phosphate oxidase [Gammaproteobacteria bacterium]
MKRHPDPYAHFRDWYAQAQESEPALPEAFALATANRDGVPSVRMMLLKGFDARGFVFFTNLESRKGEDIDANPVVSMCFHWKSLEKQVRIEGPVEPVTGEEADAYFATRPRTSQLGAWASRQSRPLQSRFELEAEVARYTAKFNVGEVPRPPHWSGFRLQPRRVEFWRQYAFRLHDRLEYRPGGEGWESRYLFP